MSGSEFFLTRMGVRFYEVTMPAIADELKRLNGNLVALVAELRETNRHTAEALGGPTTPTIPSPGDSPR